MNVAGIYITLIFAVLMIALAALVVLKGISDSLIQYLASINGKLMAIVPPSKSPGPSCSEDRSIPYRTELSLEAKSSRDLIKFLDKHIAENGGPFDLCGCWVSCRRPDGNSFIYDINIEKVVSK